MPNQSDAKPFSVLHHLSIVVADIDKATRYYEAIGIGPFAEYPPMSEYVKIEVPDEEGFYNLTIRCTQIGPVQLQLIQPGAGRSLYKEHLEKNGEGVFHLGFAVEDIEAAEQTVRDMGIEVISRGRRDNGSGFAYLGTAAGAGITLLIRQSPPE
jgi:catechol 2,3-dioxygenase-like lactoylglutathione lyase family enzyme